MTRFERLPKVHTIEREDKMNNYKSGFVTLIGRPNVGKSTLMNRLIGQKIAITSNKPQTTRNRIQTVYTCDEGQIIFLDTPGIHKAKNKLGEYMVSVAERTLKEVDVILWLVEPSTFIGAGEQHIAEQLRSVKTPVFLVINKIDTVEKAEILKFIAAYKDIVDFAEIIPVSALKGENTDDLLQAMMKYLPTGPQYYDEDTITDQPERQIVAEMIREKALRNLSDEIPHGIGKDHVVFAGAKQRDKYQRQQDSRKGNNDIVYAHQDFVNPSAKIPGERTDKNTNGSAEQQSSESDEEGCTGSF